MEKRKQIMECAMKLLIENGTQAAPMSAISRLSGMGMATIYSHFPTKQDLINEIYVFIKNDQIKSIPPPSADQPVKRQFELYYESMIRYLVSNALYFQYLDQFNNAPELTTQTREHSIKSTTYLYDILEQGQKEGLIKPIGVKQMIHFLNGGLMGFTRWIHFKNISLNNMLIQNQLQISWNAVKSSF